MYNTTKTRTNPPAKISATPAPSKRTRWPKPLIITAWIVGGYIISLFIPFINAYTAYPLAVIKCGGRPVIASKFMGGYTYMTPENKFYSVYFLNDPFLYYCSAQEAEKAGFRPTGLGQ